MISCGSESMAVERSGYNALRIKSIRNLGILRESLSNAYSPRVINRE